MKENNCKINAHRVKNGGHVLRLPRIVAFYYNLQKTAPFILEMKKDKIILRLGKTQTAS